MSKKDQPNPNFISPPNNPEHETFKDQMLRRDALSFALQTPDYIVAPNGIIKVAASYYAFLKGDNGPKPEAKPTE